MVHWLDEIERRESRRKGSGSSSARVQDKKFRIQQNYNKNKEVYETFITTMMNLINRVNNLPMEYRESFGKVNGHRKDTRLDNKLAYFSSSIRVQKMAFKGLFHPFKNVHYKHVRVIYFNIAKHMDKVEVEIYEELLEKKRRDGQVIPEHEDPKHAHKPHSEQGKFHEIYYYEMGKLNEELALKVIDWLTFREEVQHIPVIAEGEPRFKES